MHGEILKLFTVVLDHQENTIFFFLIKVYRVPFLE